MSKSMLINVIQEEESRVAIVDNGVLDFFEIETLSSETLKGNIYKGVVENVNPALEAAFVNCGWDKPGFLPLDEVNFKVLPTIRSRKTGSRILEHVAPGMEILVQVIRDRFNAKPPSLTTYYSLPGRYLVLTPSSDGSGISRRIEDEEQRAKLRQMVEDLRPPEGFGVIVRTAGIGQNRSELVRDMGYLLHLWETVERAAAIARPPSLIYRERDLALRTIRDNLTDDIEEVLIDDQEVHENALRFIRAVAPHQENRIKLYTGDKPVFTRFNLEEQIETIYKRRVPLKSGGEIVIEQTEAMTPIDVNSARSREVTAEESALRTNLEAAVEITRQMRLRDLGGLIVIDFIDMEAAKHLRAVEKAFRDSMRPDKAKYDATKISKLGIMEVSRQRLKAAKAQATYVTCSDCDGAGIVRTTEAAALAGLRRIQTRVVRGDILALKATLPTDVALYLLNQKREEILRLETRYAVRIALIPRPDYAKERCDIETQAREGPAPWVLPQQIRPAAAQKELPEAPVPRATPVTERSEPGPEDLDRVKRGTRATRSRSGRRESVARTPAPAPEPEKTIEGILAGETFEADAGEDSFSGSGDVTTPPAGGLGQETDPGITAAHVDEEPRTILQATDAPLEKAEAEETAGGTPKKKRRRRGGRGRGRKRDGEGGTELAGAGVTVEAEDIDEPGRVVWEDAEDDPIPAVHGRVEPVASVGPSDGTTGHDAGTEAPTKKRKRRRRGGRGRKKHGAIEGSAGPTHATGGTEGEEGEAGMGSEEQESQTGVVPAPVAGAGRPLPSPRAGTAGGSAPARPKRRRKHHRTVDRPAAALESVSDRSGAVSDHEGIAAHGRSAEPAPALSEVPPPGRTEEAADDDVPGGWWSRLRGAKKGGGRKD